MRAARTVRALGAGALRCVVPPSRAPTARLARFATSRPYSQDTAAPELDRQQQRQRQQTGAEPAGPFHAPYKRITLDTEYGAKSLPVAWLRDNCPQSHSPSSGNKSFATSEIPEDIDVESATWTADGGLTVRWKNDIPRFAAQGHVTTFTADQLRGILRRLNKGLSRTKVPNSDISIIPPLFWDRRTLQDRVLRVTYADWVGGGDAFFRAVAELQLTGLVFVTDVPPDRESVATLGLAFGALQETFYGRTWDVVSKPRAENVAYTSDYLGLHSDMLYLSSPPRLQFLHCLENEAEGGESLFSDAGRAARELRMFHPEDAGALQYHGIVYHYNANGFSYQQKRPVIQERRGPTAQKIVQPWWSPPFQGPFNPPVFVRDTLSFEGWHRAARKFQDLIEDPEAVHRHRLRPGECAVFDNCRVLHGRTAFDPSTGPRHLRGAYVHDDDWNSTLRHVPDHVNAAVSGNAYGPRSSSDLFNSLRYVKYRHLTRGEIAPPPAPADQDDRSPEQRRSDAARRSYDGTRFLKPEELSDRHGGTGL